jgi:hypothetical protein
MVLNHLPRDPGHLQRLLGKHINIILEESDERKFLFVTRVPAMQVVWVASTPIWMTFMEMSSLSEGCKQGADDEPRWRELDGPLSHSPKLAATSWAAASVWSFSSAIHVDLDDTAG